MFGRGKTKGKWTYVEYFGEYMTLSGVVQASNLYDALHEVYKRLDDRNYGNRLVVEKHCEIPEEGA